MKFGETLYDRSPRFPNQNLPYNELKHIIKQQTSADTAANPLPIPGQSSHRWSLLEDGLFQTLKIEHDNIVLFLRSKIGEIERRLTFLNKSVKSAKRWATSFSGRPTLLARKFQKLVYDAEQIGEDIQALSQYAAVQKLAFRKILKKYRKWTGSDGLQSRMDREVFSQGQLQPDLTEPMKELSIQLSRIADLEGSMLNNRSSTNREQEPTTSPRKLESPISQINSAAKAGPLNFDSALASVPFGEAADTAVYWIHPDNLEEARILLLRYMRDIKTSAILKREPSSTSATSNGSSSKQLDGEDETHVAYFDNAQRFIQDTSSHSPSHAALTARWSLRKDAVVDMSDMQPQSDLFTTVTVRRKDLAPVLDRADKAATSTFRSTADVNTIKEWLSQHRDVKPLAHLRSHRSRFAGITNSAEVGTFGTLDVNVAFSGFRANDIASPPSDCDDDGKFPHAILEIRWEFGPRPEVVRAFDSTHLAEKIEDFTLELAAILSQNRELCNPKWSDRLSEDIRKVPKIRTRRQDSSGLTSGPSSADGPSESIFSIPEGRSITGSDSSPMTSVKDDASPTVSVQPKKKQKRARIDSHVRSPKRDQSIRYYSEYDDPDSELYQADTYTIYVNPDEEAFGMATLRKIGGWLTLPFTSMREKKDLRPEMAEPSERTPLFGGSARLSQDEEDISSESDNDQLAKVKSGGRISQQHPLDRYRKRLNRRQRAWETTLTRFSAGLLVLAYAFLLISGILLTTGRKKEVLEVNAGASTGVFISFICTFLALFLTFRRKKKLALIERSTLTLAIGMDLVLGASIIVVIVSRATAAHRQNGISW